MITISSDNKFGYINESFKHLIERIPDSDIDKYVNNINSELGEKQITDERKRELLERLSFCQKKLRE